MNSDFHNLKKVVDNVYRLIYNKGVESKEDKKMIKIYFVKRNGLPLLGTARATIEQARSLCDKLSEQCGEQLETGEMETNRSKDNWNDALQSYYFHKTLLGW